jgi:hypothetical protein
MRIFLNAGLFSGSPNLYNDVPARRQAADLSRKRERHKSTDL